MIKQRALSLLARREHSRQELRLKLLRKGFSIEEIEPLLNTLQADNLLSDDRFIACFIRSRLRKGHGPLKICAELQNRGIDPTRIFANEEWLVAEWQEGANAVRIKRFGESAPTCRVEQSKQARYLQQRGFTADQIRKALKSIAD